VGSTCATPKKKGVADPRLQTGPCGRCTHEEEEIKFRVIAHQKKLGRNPLLKKGSGVHSRTPEGNQQTGWVEGRGDAGNKKPRTNLRLTLVPCRKEEGRTSNVFDWHTHMPKPKTKTKPGEGPIPKKGRIAISSKQAGEAVCAEDQYRRLQRQAGCAREKRRKCT